MALQRPRGRLLLLRAGPPVHRLPWRAGCVVLAVPLLRARAPRKTSWASGLPACDRPLAASGAVRALCCQHALLPARHLPLASAAPAATAPRPGCAAPRPPAAHLHARLAIGAAGHALRCLLAALPPGPRGLLLPEELAELLLLLLLLVLQHLCLFLLVRVGRLAHPAARHPAAAHTHTAAWAHALAWALPPQLTGETLARTAPLA